jgi:hypothetical protein
MPRNKNGIKDIALDKHKLNTPGRESFSGKASSILPVLRQADM